MTEEVNNKSEAPAGGEPAETVENLKAKIAELETAVTNVNGEAAKQKALRRKAEQERDEAKKTAKPSGQDGSEDYKKLWKETNDKLTASLDRAKKADINSALTDQFGKAKVALDRFSAALKLIDSSIVEWDEEAGVDSASVVAAVQKLKTDHAFLFETTVNPTDVKLAGDGTGKGTITRSIFDTLSPMDKAAKVKSGIKIID